MMKLKIQITEVRCSVEIPVETFIRFSNDDEAGNLLIKEMEALEGVRNINWDGHFGAFIFFDVESEMYSDPLKEKIYNILRRVVMTNDDTAVHATDT